MAPIEKHKIKKLTPSIQDPREHPWGAVPSDNSLSTLGSLLCESFFCSLLGRGE